jgi:hypothetical protein
MPIYKSSNSGTPFGDTASRPANPQLGQTYYNGTLGYLEIYTSAGWIPATGANDFSLNLSGPHTSITLTQSYSSGSYSIVSSSNDTTMDIYAYATDGSLAGYTNTKSFTASQRFSKMVILGGTTGDVLSFSYKTTYATSISTTDVTSGPYITSITPSGMPNQNDTITITGGNFAINVAVAFTGSGYSSTPAKSIVRSSETSLIVTRPDNFPISGSPYTVTVTNPSVANQPTGSAVHQYSGITAGVIPVWNTATVLPSFTKNTAYSTTVSATDPDGGTITYSYVSGSLPTGLSFNASTATISGTPTTSTDTSYTIRATDSGGNYTDKTFTVKNIGPTWVTSGNINNYVSGSAYSYQLSATDDSGDSPTYALASGSLPSGLSISSSGLISGTSSAGTTNTFTVSATDVNGNTSTSNSLTIGPAPVVSGGTLSSDSTYYYRTFTGVGTLTVSNNSLNAEVLLIAGGGSGGGQGGNDGAGGGGAGGLVYAVPVLSTGNYSITVGGGASAAATSTLGSNGTNSTFTGLTTAVGGGGGGAEVGVRYGASGGSGGGGGGYGGYVGGSSTQGSGTTATGIGYGNVGGTANDYINGGGGGAGEAGKYVGNVGSATAGANGGGRGGNGLSTWSSWGAATGYGQNISGTYWFAGGGGSSGDARWSTTNGWAGGNGGGGAGANATSGSNGTNGTNGTGGGGGGAAGTSPSGSGRVSGAGGSGICIVRYTRTQVGG